MNSVFNLRVLLTATLLISIAAATASAAVISSDLRAALAAADSDQPIGVILNLRERVDPTRFTGGRTGATALITDLRETADRSQPAVLEWLGERGADTDLKTFWINNSIALAAKPALIQALAELEELASIDLDVPVRRLETAAADPSDPADRDPVWNLELVGVPAVWTDYNLTGEGIVVGSLDTGADVAHPALQGKWRGGGNSWIDLVNDQPSPYDDHGHGTHTIGTMVGGDGPGPFHPDIGVAPGAQFIAAKVLDQNNSFSSASIVIAGAQWMLDPDDDPVTDDFPHVVNNSWYFFSQTYTGFYSSAAAWRAAGIIPVFCLGNEGPNLSTTRPPGSYDNVIGVGATTSSDQVWRWSSRGPSPAGAVFPVDLRKPDLSAPGDLVQSSFPGGVYAIWSGTSMATPHVAGTIALMLQLRPELTYDDIRSALLDHAVDLGDAGFDFDSGYGRLGTYATIESLISTPAPDLPVSAVLHPCRPNPFNPLTTISYELVTPSNVELGVYDLRGRQVAVLDQGARAAGRHSLTWGGRDARGRSVPSGAYVVRLTMEHGVEARTVMLAK